MKISYFVEKIELNPRSKHLKKHYLALLGIQVFNYIPVDRLLNK